MGFLNKIFSLRKIDNHFIFILCGIQIKIKYKTDFKCPTVKDYGLTTQKRDKKWNKILSKIPSNDIHLVSNTEETRSSESTTKTTASKTSAGQASDNSSDDTYSYKDFLDYANDYINIAAGQSTPSSSSLDTTTSLTSNTALLTTLSKLLSSQKS